MTHGSEKRRLCEGGSFGRISGAQDLLLGGHFGGHVPTDAIESLEPSRFIDHRCSADGEIVQFSIAVVALEAEILHRIAPRHPDLVRVRCEVLIGRLDDLLSRPADIGCSGATGISFYAV